MDNVMFLIAHANRQPWHNIFKYGCLPTWIKSLREKDDYILVESDGSLGPSSEPIFSWTDQVRRSNQIRMFLDLSPRRLDNRLIVRSHYGIGGMLETSVSAIQWALQNTDYEYFVRTNTSSYWDIPRFSKILGTFPKTELYAGYIANAGFDFVSGAGIVFTRDIAIKIVSHYEELNNNLAEDLALSQLIYALGIPYTWLPRLDLLSLTRILSVSQETLNSNFHFRCKSVKSGVRIDPVIMHVLHRRLKTPF